MLIFDAKKVKAILIQEGDYSNYYAEETVHLLKKLNKQLQEPLNEWIQDRTISDEFSIEGVTLKTIMEKDRCDFCNAMFYLDTFITYPEKARSYLTTPKFFMD